MARTLRALHTLAALVAVALGSCVLVLSAAAPATAHAALVSVSPADGEQVVATGPLTVSLTFTEAIDPAFATVVVVDASEAVVAAEPTRVDGATVSQVMQAVPAAGEYRVRFRVVSADGHPVDGESGFTVTAPAPSPAGSAGESALESEPSAGSASEPGAGETAGGTEPQQTEPDDSGIGSGDGSGLPLAAGAVALAGLLGGGALVARRRGDGGRR